jgi:flagellar biosynthesis/type III secretory pathway protein FliH
MLTAEWDMNEALKVSKEEGWEEGIEKGIEKGREETRDLLYTFINQAKSVEDLKRMLAASPLRRQNSDAGAV